MHCQSVMACALISKFIFTIFITERLLCFIAELSICFQVCTLWFFSQSSVSSYLHILFPMHFGCVVFPQLCFLIYFRRVVYIVLVCVYQRGDFYWAESSSGYICGQVSLLRCLSSLAPEGTYAVAFFQLSK